MPDMLVLTRDRKNGSLKMCVEIDNEPAPRPKWESRPLPEPVRTFEPPTTPSDEDIEWLQDAVAGYVDALDWYPDELVHVDWDGLNDDVAWLAHQ